MKHDELQESLARHLRASTDRMVWTNTQLGPSGSPRPDVFTVNKSFSRFRADCYEIKVSVSDLRHDVTSGKWQSYRKFGHAVWFAFPRGMVSLDLIPKECGVILYGETWRAARKPVAQVLDSLPRDTWLKLLMDGPEMSHVKLRETNSWQIRSALDEKMGKEAVALFDARDSAKYRYMQATEEMNQSAVRITAEVARLRANAVGAVEREQVRLNKAMESLGYALGMKEGEINADTLRSKMHKTADLLNSYHLQNTIDLLQSLKNVMDENTLKVAA